MWAFFFLDSSVIFFWGRSRRVAGSRIAFSGMVCTVSCGRKRLTGVHIWISHPQPPSQAAESKSSGLTAFRGYFSSRYIWSDESFCWTAGSDVDIHFTDVWVDSVPDWDIWVSRCYHECWPEKLLLVNRDVVCSWKNLAYTNIDTRGEIHLPKSRCPP